jgi:adhesin HecA-like repeat protein
LDSSDRVEVHQGKSQNVVVKGSADAVRAADVTVINGRIVVTRSMYGRIPKEDRKGFLVEITAPIIEEVIIRGSGEVRMNDPHQLSFLGTVDGSGTLQLKGANLDNSTFQINGSGTIEASGAARSMLVELAGSGSFSGAGMMAEDLNVDSSGSGSVLASASRETVVSISGSGHVKVRGGSACRSEVTSGGRLDCR